MKITAALILCAFALATFGSSPAQAQQCPVGSYPWVDSWGNKTCKRYSDGSAATTEAPRGQTCPMGSYSWVDSWGNKICRTYETGNQPRTDYYDTSKGCPVGTYEWADEWGNKVCKKY